MIEQREEDREEPVSSSPRKRFEELAGEARKLVAEYRQALRERAAAGRSWGRREATRKIVDIKQRRDDFLQTLPKKNLSLNSRRKIEEILAAIPQT